MPFLKITSYIGWTSGILLLDRPWGIPRFSSWFSISSLVSIASLFLMSFLATDIIVNYDPNLEDKEIGKLGQYLGKISGSHRIIFYFITRFTFFCNAKKLASFINRIYYYPSRNGPLLKRNLKKFDSFIILLSYCCSVIITINATIFASRLFYGKSSNFLLRITGPVVYSIVLAIFGILPIGVSDTIAFSVVIATIRAILRIYKEFCDDLECLLLHNSTYGRQKSSDLSGQVILLDLENEFKRFTKTKSRIGPNYKETREEIIRKFYDMVEIFCQAQKVTAPFVFVILIVTTVELVSAVSNVVVIRHRGAYLVNDIVIMIKVMIHLCILQVGHRIQTTLSKGKAQVRRAFIHCSAKQEMRDVVNVVLSWEWKLSGLGFFDVDRKLAAGIISLLLSYVVIIFQLQLALSPSAVSL